MEWLTWGVLLLILGIFCFILAQLNVFGGKGSAKTSRRKMFTWVGVIVLVLGLLPVVNITDYGIDSLGSTIFAVGIDEGAICGNGRCEAGETTVSCPADCVAEGQLDIIGCDRSASLTGTLAGVDKYNETAAGGTHRIKVGGGAWTTVADLGTFTYSPFQTLDVLWEQGATTGYLSKHVSYTTPCAVNTWREPLVINGTITSTVKDDNDVVVDGTTTNNFTIGANDVLTGKVILKGVSEREFPYGVLAVLDWNKSSLDDVKLYIEGTSNEYSTSGVKVPQTYTEIQAGATSYTKAYLLPAFEKSLTYDIELDADNDLNPTNAGEPANVTVTYYILNYYVDNNNAGNPGGPAAEDEDFAVTRSGQYTTNVFYD